MDNPQMPSYYNTQASEIQEEIQRGFITRVYAWMTFGLLVTAGAALFTVNVPGLLATILTGRFTFVALLGAELLLVVVLSAAVARLSPVLAGLLFFVYAGLNGVTMAVILLLYTQQSIAVTFGVTACTFGIMTLFGYTTQRDLTRLGTLLIMALLGLVVASLVNLFFSNPAVYWITTYAGILIFIGLVAYDTQKLKRMSLGLGEDGQAAQKASILGALMLYLDFINLFLLLLRLLGKRK
jgi:FtsH-binding integral membrane protein